MDPSFLRRAYDRDADGYDVRFAAQQRAKYEEIARVVPPPTGGRVLDLGGGTGMLAETLGAAGWPTDRFVVADLSHGMLRRATSRGLSAVQCDARRLPFARGTFSAVVSVTGLVGAEQVEPALVSAVRVLAPGGTLAVSLLPGDVPDGFEALTARLPLDRLHEGPAGVDRLFVWRRRGA